MKLSSLVAIAAVTYVVVRTAAKQPARPPARPLGDWQRPPPMPGTIVH